MLVLYSVIETLIVEVLKALDTLHVLHVPTAVAHVGLQCYINRLAYHPLYARLHLLRLCEKRARKSVAAIELQACVEYKRPSSQYYSTLPVTLVA